MAQDVVSPENIKNRVFQRSIYVVFEFLGWDLLVSNPTSYRNAAPTHTAHQTTRQALATLTSILISICIVHRDRPCARERVLS